MARAPLLILAAVALSACATREHVRALQAPPSAPRGAIMFEESHEFRDAVVLSYVGNVSQYSYVFAEPNGAIIRSLRRRGLADSGLAAGTPVRGRYGIAVEVLEASGPSIGGDFHARLRARYVVRELASGRTVFDREFATDSTAPFLGLHEGDLRTATQRSMPLLRGVALAGIVPAAFDAAYDNDYFSGEWDEYEQWTQDDWNDFWRGYSQAMLFSALWGPVTVGVEFINPWNFIPWADDEAAMQAASASTGHDGAMRMRMGSERAASVNHAVAAANVTAFLVAFADSQDVTPTPILPCWGSPEIERLKTALLLQGRRFITDDCRVRR